MEENKNFEETIEKVEKKTLKEVIAENKGKILIGASYVVIAVGGYLIYKNRMKIDLHDMQIDLHDAQINDATDNIDFVRDIVKEGALEEAIATVNRKINYRLDRLSHMKDNNSDLDKELIGKYAGELKDLIEKQKAFVAEYDSIAIK